MKRLPKSLLLLTMTGLLGTFPAAVQTRAQTDTNWKTEVTDGLYGSAENWTNGTPSSTNPAFFTGVTLNLHSVDESQQSGTSSPISLPANATLTINGGAAVTIPKGTNADGAGFTTHLDPGVGTILNVGGGTDSTGSLTTKGHFRLAGSKTGKAAVVNVLAGGTLNTDSYFLFGNGSSNAGTLNVEGGTVNANSSSMTVGDNGVGIVNLNSGTLNVKCTFEIGNHNNSSGTINQNGGTLKATGSFHVGGGDSTTDRRASTGVFNYSAGTLSSTQTIQVGYGPGAVGTFNVKSGADLTLGSAMGLGILHPADYAANGFLVLEAGTNADHTTMSTTRDLTVGAAGNGTMTVNAFADFTSTAAAAIGSQSGGVGQILVKKDGTAGFATLNVGVSGTGELALEAGASVTAATLNAGTAAGGNGTISVTAGSSLTAANMNLGSSGTSTDAASAVANVAGNLTINRQLIVGNSGAVSPELNVTGNGVLTINMIQEDSTFVVSNLRNGGQLNVTDSAQFNTNAVDPGQNYLAIGSSGTGTLNYSSSAASTWKGTVRIGGGGTGYFYLSGGSINQTGNHLIVGSSTRGTFEISNDAKATLKSIYVGDSKPGTQYACGGDVLAKNTSQTSMEKFYLADKTNTYGNLTVQDQATVLISGLFRVGTSQHYAESTHTSALGGGKATVLVQDQGVLKCGYFLLGNTKDACELNVQSGTFQTTGATDSSGNPLASLIRDTGKIVLAGGSATTVSLAGALTLQDEAAMKVTDGTTLSGTDLTFTGQSSLELDGLYEFAALTGSASFGDQVNVTINLENPYQPDGTYQLINAANGVGKISTLTLLSAAGQTILKGDSPYLNYANGLALAYSQEIAPLPEPAAWLLLVLGSVGAVFLRRQKSAG